MFRTSGFATITLLTALTSTSCGGVVSAGGLTVAGLLDRLKTQVNSTIDAAGAESQGVVAQAGAEVLYALDATRLNLEASMKRTAEALGGEAGLRLQAAESMVEVFKSDTASAAQVASAKATVLVSQLPFANGEPKVDGWTPRYVTGTAPVTLKVTGYFPNSREGTEPRLEIAGSEFVIGQGESKAANTGNTTTELTFVLPPNVFPPPQAGMVEPVTADLTVPYRSKVLRRDATARYSLLIGTLPSSPGKVTFYNTVKTSETETAPIVMDVPSQSGNENSPRTTIQCVTLSAEEVAEGWRLTARKEGDEPFHKVLSSREAEGSAWWIAHEMDTPNKRCVRVFTREWSNGFLGIAGYHSGEVKIQLRAEKHRVVWKSSMTKVREEVLAWNKSSLFPIQAGNPWQLVYEPPSGPAREIASVDLRGPFMEVKITGDNAVVTTLEPGGIRF